MYFAYTAPPVLLETIQVPGDGTTVQSTTVLDAAEQYGLKATGTYRFANWGEYGIADAQCSYRPAAYGGPGWVNGALLGSANYLEVWVDGSAFDWQPTDCDEATHTYTGGITGTGQVSFFIPDSCGGGTLGCYGDNSGYITVELWWTG
jgi:hypothetical protein